MPNIKSAIKRLEISKRLNAQNTAAKTLMKTNIKKFETAVISGDKEQAESEYKNVIKTLDKAVSKGFLHKNTAARKKSRLSKKMNELSG